MRVGHVTFGYRPTVGGAETYLHELLRVLGEAGYVQRVYQRSTGEAGEGILPVPTWRGLSPGKQFWSLAFTLPLRWPWLVREDALVVHYPLYVLPVYWHPRLIGLSHGVTWDEGYSYRGGSEGVDPGGGTPSWEEQMPRRARAARIKRWLARVAFRRCRAFVANDTFFLREMGVKVAPRQGAFTAVRPGRWFIPNCVDTDRFAPTPGREDVRARNAVLVPRNFYRNRGIHLAVAAFPQVLRHFPECHLVIAGGPGDPGYQQEVRAAVEKLGIASRVCFLGSVPWRDMPALYSAARLTVIPSLCGEGTSLSALESMACGTPVVATAVGGLPDLPVELAAPDPVPLAEAIVKALSERDALAQAQQRAVRAEYHLGRWAEAWRRVLADVLR
ncbi:MAG: glycosyltransferase family 4 protein [Armatimonadota bacterium]|nr:glycosyltransferase family 4 protein [Armatimonadota bacterium]